MVWRTGLRGTSSRERMAILEAEQKAKEVAFGRAYQKRCDESGDLLPDARDLAVGSVRVQWTRKDRRLYLFIKVFAVRGNLIGTYQWKSPTVR